MTYLSPFPTFATPAQNQLAASLWLSLLRSFPVNDTLGLMLLEQLAFSHWAASELARKQSRDLAAGADPDSPSMLRLSRERRAECRLQAQLARQLNQELRNQAAQEHPANEKLSNLSYKLSTPSTITSIPSNNSSQTAQKIGTLSNTSAPASPNPVLPTLNDLLPNLDELYTALTGAAKAGTR